MAYNNRSGEPSFSQSNNLSPARFAQNPTRARSTRWTAAKAHNYDGDDWGDEYGDDDYDSLYTSQPVNRGNQYGGSSQPQQYGNQEFGFSRSSTQPVSQGYPKYETTVEEPKPLARQGTSPAVPETPRYSSSGIQRKPSKMDKDRTSQYIEQTPTDRPAPFYNPNQQPTSPYAENRPTSFVEDDHTATSSGYYHQPSSPPRKTFNETAVHDGYTTPPKQPSSPTQSTKGSPTLRRPAEIYAAMRQSMEAPSITVDFAGSDTKAPTDIEAPKSPEQPSAQPTEPSVVYIESMVPDVATADVKTNGDSKTAEHEPEPEVASPSVPKEQIEVPAVDESPKRNSNLFLDVNTNDDINRNVKLVTPPPSQPNHFLMIPEPTREPTHPAYDSDDEMQGLFHTSTPPRRGSLSPTSDIGYGPSRLPLESEPEVPVETQAPAPETEVQTSNPIPPQAEATSPSDYGTHPPSSQASPTTSPTQPSLSIAEKVAGTTSAVSNVFSSLVSNAFGKGDSSEDNSPTVQGGSATQAPKDQSTSPTSPLATVTVSPEIPSGPPHEVHVPAEANAPSVETNPPANASLQRTVSIPSRGGTPDEFDEYDEVTIEEARTGAWGAATHVAISQSPTKSPAQSPLSPEVSQPIITKTTEPVIHTPQPTPSQIEQSTLIRSQPPSERAISPASHVSSTQSKSPSLTTAAPSNQPARTPPPTSFASFLARSQNNPPIQNSPPSAPSGTPTPSAPVSFKTFMTSRTNTMPEPERTSPPASGFKAFLSQKAPPSQNEPIEPLPDTASKAEPSVEAPAKPVDDESLPPPNAPAFTSEGEALRQSILRRLDAESQPQTPDTPEDNQKGETQFGISESATEKPETESSIPSEPRQDYKGKAPQRTASVTVSDVSDDQNRPQSFENPQYSRFHKPGKSYPPPPASDISALSKSDEGVITPPTRSIVGESAQDYEPSIQEDRDYQQSVISDNYMPSPVDTVHPTKPLQPSKAFNSEVPTLLELSDILALSDAKDRIAASEKARKILAQQGQQGAYDLQVWLQHVQQVDQQNAQLWTYNSKKPGMRDLRSNPLVSGRFDLMHPSTYVDQNVPHPKWKGWARLDDGVQGSRPSTAASDDYMAPKKPAIVAPVSQPQDQFSGQPLPQQAIDNRQQFGQPGGPQQNQLSAYPPAQQPLQQPAPGQEVPPNALRNAPPQQVQANGPPPEAPKQEEHHEDRKKPGFGKIFKGILGRKKGKGDPQPTETPSQQPPQVSQGPPQGPQGFQPPQNLQAPLQGPPPQGPPPQGLSKGPPQGPPQGPQAFPQGPPQGPQGYPQGPPQQSQPLYQPPASTPNEKFPPNLGQPATQQFPARSSPGPQANGQLPPPTQQPTPPREEFLPPLSFQQGNKSPGLAAVVNISASSSVPDLRTQNQSQQPKDGLGVQSPNQLQQPSPGPSQPITTQQGVLQPPAVTPVAQRSNIPSEYQDPGRPQNDDDDVPPPLRRLSTSKPPPPRKQRISSIPGTVPEGAPPGHFDPAHIRESHESHQRPGTSGSYPMPPGGQPLGPSHLRPQDTSSAYEPSVSENSVTSDHTGKKTRFSMFGRNKNTSATPNSSSTAQIQSENTGSPRHSIHTIGSQPSATGVPTEKRNSSFFQTQLKKFDQLVVGKERANEFHHQQQAQAQQQPHYPPPQQGQPPHQPGPDPGINRQQSFPVDGSNSIQPESKKKGRFAALLSDRKTDGAGHEEKKSRKPSFFGGKGRDDSQASTPVQSTPPPQAWPTPQNPNQTYQQPQGPPPQQQVPIYNPDQNVVVPIPGQYYSVGQDSQIQQSQGPYTNGPPAPQGAQGAVPQTPATQGPPAALQGIPPPPTGSTQYNGLSRKPSSPPPPAARFLAVPPSPPPVSKQTKAATAPLEEESIYSPPITSKAAVMTPLVNDDAPPPMKPYQTFSPSPPPRIVYSAPLPVSAPPPVVSQVAPAQTEPVRSTPVEPAPVAQRAVSPEQTIVVPSPVVSRGKAPDSFPSSNVPQSGSILTEVISVQTGPAKEIPPPKVEPPKVETPKEEPPTVEITPATATETEPPKSQQLQQPTVEVAPPKVEEPPKKVDTPEVPKAESPAPAESSSNPRAEPVRIVSNEDFDKIAVDPEGPVPLFEKPEEEERIVMSATTMPGSHDWEYF
ncbi:hypothetical protein ABW19_dt0207362 [Dactylella cylindrospora]|nr:hypothetical protein ABW19_dt0207362 [Dactylella cylindrospora]